MNTAAAGGAAPASRWWLDPALVRLAFGSQAAPRAAPGAGTMAPHLAFLPADALELDLDDPQQREFGDYELREVIGQGGMGVVYRAHQTSLDREVALKLLSAGPWASAEFIAGFRREAQNAALLQHPNIVAVHAMGEHEGLIYYAMELVRGQSLAQRLERGPLPAREAAALLRTAAEAVDYAHRLGVLHLDLKPGNVLLDPCGVPKVADFGLARRLGQALSLENEQISGTPSYMAPEQAQIRSARLSPATDVWGLGAVLYELLTGVPPFIGTTPQDTLHLVLAGEVRRLGRHARVPRDLEAICLKCLNKPQQERYASARELADDLGRFLENRSVRARALNAFQRAVRWARREPKFAIASGLAVLALVAGLVATTQQWQRAEDNAETARQQTWRTRGDAAWRLVDEGRTVDALPLLIDNLREREVHGDSSGAALERLRLGTLQRGGAQLIDAIATGAVGRAVDIDRKGERVAVADLDEQLRLYAVADGRLLWRSSTRQATYMRAVGMPLTRVDFSRDGRYLITATMEPPKFIRPHGRNNVLVDAADGRVVVPPRERFPDFLDATYSADGRYALLRGKGGEIRFFKVDGWRPLTPKRSVPSLAGSWRIGDGGRYLARSLNHRIELLDTRSLESRYAHQFDPARGINAWAAQPGGRLLALGHADGAVRLLDSADSTMRELKPAPFDPIGALSFSDDGRWLLAGSGGRVFAWDVASGSGGVLPGRPIDATRIQADAATGTVFAFNWADALLWQVPASADDAGDFGRRVGGARVQVSQFAFGNGLPRNAAAYAPAANLAADIERNGELRLWRWRDSRPLRARASAHNVDELHFDGRHVVVVDGRRVRVVEVDGERKVSPDLVHPQPVSLATFAPDGRTLVTVSGRELRVFDWRAGRLRFAPIALADSPVRVAIGPDSQVLLATTGGYRDRGYREFASTFDLRTGAALARGVALHGPLNGLRFSPDGQSLVHWRYGEAEIRAAASLRRHGQPLRFGADIMATRSATAGLGLDAATLARETPIVDAAISKDGTRLTLIVSGYEPVKPRLVQADIRSGRTQVSRVLSPGYFSRLWPRADGYDFAAWDAAGTARWVDSSGSIRAMPQVRGEPQFAQAVSRDGRWFAVASTGGVLLADRDSGEWATTALDAQWPQLDAIAQLAFTPDGSRLLARSQTGRLTWWPLSPEAKPVAQLARRAAHLRPAPDAGAEPIAPALPTRERTALRATDPGGPRAAVGSPAASGPLAAGSATPGFAFVELQPAINRPVDAAGLLDASEVGMLPPVPLGIQRFLGVDFDIRGVVALRMREAPQPPPGLPVASPAVGPPQPRFAAVHLLLGACCPLPGHREAPYAYLALRYTDGSHARIPILLRHHLWWSSEDVGDAIPARIAWATTTPWGYPQRLYAARLANPHPERDVASLAFEASETFASGPLIFAATAEIGSAAAVTAAPAP